MTIEFIVGVLSVFVYWLHVRLTQLEAMCEKVKPGLLASAIKFYTTINGQKIGVTKMFLKVSEQLPLSIAIKDKFGNAAKVDGAPVWALTDPSLGTLTAADDGMSALFVPSGTVGAFKVQVSADADLGEGVKSIVGELDVELLPGEAVSVEISAGQAEPIP